MIDYEFATAEICKTFQELGYKKPCLAYYNIDPMLVKPGLNIVKPFKHEWCLPALLWQQAIDWLRKKYKLHITITSISQDSWQWHITKPGESLGKLYDEDFYTYETAREDAIKEALKLIKKHNGTVTTNRKR